MLDNDARLGRPPRTRGTCARRLLPDGDCGAVALPVNDVLGVVSSPGSAIGPAPGGCRAAAGTAALPDGVLVISTWTRSCPRRTSSVPAAALPDSSRTRARWWRNGSGWRSPRAAARPGAGPRGLPALLATLREQPTTGARVAGDDPRADRPRELLLPGRAGAQSACSSRSSIKRRGSGAGSRSGSAGRASRARGVVHARDAAGARGPTVAELNLGNRH